VAFLEQCKFMGRRTLTEVGNAAELLIELAEGEALSKSTK
jgi:hypothetical protein